MCVRHPLMFRNSLIREGCVDPQSESAGEINRDRLSRNFKQTHFWFSQHGSVCHKCVLFSSAALPLSQREWFAWRESQNIYVYSAWCSFPSSSSSLHNRWTSYFKSETNLIPFVENSFSAGVANLFHHRCIYTATSRTILKGILNHLFHHVWENDALAIPLTIRFLIENRWLFFVFFETFQSRKNLWNHEMAHFTLCVGAH